MLNKTFQATSFLVVVILIISSPVLISRAQSNGITERVSVSSSGEQGNDESRFSSISANGRYVAFVSIASNLVSGDTNGVWDVFVHDRLLRTTERVSVSSDGIQGNDLSNSPSISADGRFVAFFSDATNFIPPDPYVYSSNIFVRDRQKGTTEIVDVSSRGEIGSGYDPSISADGQFVAFQSSATNLVD
jgi:Tol biopolymer transport system component